MLLRDDVETIVDATKRCHQTFVHRSIYFCDNADVYVVVLHRINKQRYDVSAEWSSTPI